MDGSSAARPARSGRPENFAYGSESYGGGRYLDVPFVESGRVFIDFNRAYNPSCAYNTGFACPVPPPENRLPVPIPAGEMVFAKHE